MKRQLLGFGVAAMIGLVPVAAQIARNTFEAFEVATIKPTAPEDYRGARYIRMESAHRFQARNYTVNGLIAAAWNLAPGMISGGPAWTESEHFDTVAATPGEARPTPDEQMAMLQKLLTERFRLAFHREPKEMAVYTLTVAKGGPKLRESLAPPDESHALVNTLYPAASGGIDHILLPGRNVTVGQLASVMQRAVLDRPVLDKTSLSGRFDFDLEWAPDERQFGGQLPAGAPDTPRPDLFAAVRQQLGLQFEAGKGAVQVLVIDHVERPSEN